MFQSPVDDEYSQLKKVERNNEDNEVFSKKHAQRGLNRPTKEQIEKILEYKKKFSNYSKRNTYLANSDINEIKLFDR